MDTTGVKPYRTQRQERIIIAGFGGQGIMLMGKLLALAALKENKYVTWLPSYGAEVRGGTAHCMVIISDEEIASPVVEYADTLIAMNSLSLDKFKSRLKPKGLLIMNQSLIKKNSKVKTKDILKAPFTDLASALGDGRVANTIALGAYATKKKIVSAKTILKVMQEFIPPGRKDLLEVNIKALQEGIKIGCSG